jgi:hypothetical protein
MPSKLFAMVVSIVMEKLGRSVFFGGTTDMVLGIPTQIGSCDYLKTNVHQAAPSPLRYRTGVPVAQFSTDRYVTY